MSGEGWDAWCEKSGREPGGIYMNCMKNSARGGVSASKKLLAAIAVLAVVLAATAVVLVSDDVSATETSVTSKDGVLSVTGSDTLKVTADGNKFVFSGYAETGKINAVDGYNFETNFGNEAKLFAGVQFTMNLKGITNTNIEVTQKNSALQIYPDDENITDDTKVSAADRSKPDMNQYEFLIPKDGSSVTITLKNGTSHANIIGTYTFDFSEVSTKVVLGTDELTGTGWTYKSGTLTFNNYNGREIFYGNDALSVVLNGTNTISAYGVAKNYGGSAIYAGKTLSIVAASEGASLKVTQNTAGAYGIVSYDDKTTIGSTEDSAKKVTLAVDGEPNRAIYAVKGLVVNNATIVAQSTEKTIRSSVGISIGVNATIDAKLVSLSGNGQGDDDYMGIKGASLTVGKGSTVTTQGLCLTGNAPFGDNASSVIAGKVIVSGDYSQNPNTKVKPIIAGLYLKAAVDGIGATRAVPAADATGIFLINDAQAYNIDVKTKDGKVAETTVADASNANEELAKKDIQTVTLSSSDAIADADINVPAGKTLIVSASAGVSGTITTEAITALKRSP